MNIRLWSRNEGIVRPPARPLHAERGSKCFPPAFRTRVWHWTISSFKQFEWGTQMGEVINPVGLSLDRLYAGLCGAYGRQVLHVPGGSAISSSYQQAGHQLPGFLNAAPDLEVLDYIDAVFQICRHELYDGNEHPGFDRMSEEINSIFEDEGVGYRLIAGRLARWDDEVIHREAIVPALAALDERFGSAGPEFDSAVAAFARGEYRDTLTHANAALESVLKVVTGQNGTSGDLIKAARNQGLIPSYAGASRATGSRGSK